MKKKLILMSAALAAVATFTGCSSEDDVLAQGQEPVAQKKGTPFSVVVTDETGTTRATLIDGTTLTNFKLYGKNTEIADADAQMWVNGNVFKYGTAWAAYDAAGTATATLTWPVDAENKALTTPTQFWAVSDNSDAGVTIGSTASTGTSGITENDIAASQSFVYNFLTGDGETLQYGQRNNYTTKLEGNVVDLSKQNDLLVASASQTEGTDGQLTLAFRHALSSLAFKARFTSHENGESTGGINDNEEITIYWLRVYGLKGSGTFTYNDTYDVDAKRWGTSPWSSPATDVVYEYNFGDDGITIKEQNHTSGEITKTTLISHTAMMVIPQTFTPWAGVNNAPANCYVEMSVKSTTGISRRNYARLPLTIPSTNNTFLAGVKHTITLNLNYLCNASNEYIFSPSDGGGSARAIEFE
ncbi:MAG: fimbrillin family protein [Prevotella sp.]|nr:fimbrillin family protein [Prevotella sp.]